MATGLLPLIGIAFLGQIAAQGQVSIDGQTAQRPVWLDTPTPQTSNQSLWDQPPPADRPLRHLVKQATELPPAPTGLPLPSPARFERLYPTNDRFLTVDYVFMPTSEVQGATQGIMMNEVAADYRLTKPFFSTPAAFTFRPGIGALFLGGPGPVPELPSTLYKIALDFQIDVPFGEVVGLSLGITPGLWTDFMTTDSEDFRLPARALLTFRASDTLFIAAGALYTDNIRRNVLPGGGIIWQPTEKWNLELLYPRSRLVYRFDDVWSGYVVFEKGGTTYNIRTQGQDEDFEYRDNRLMLGVELTKWGFADLFAEAGASFWRELRFDIQPTAEVDSSFILRFGARF